MTCGTVSAAETGQPQRDPGTSLAMSRPTDNGPRSEAQSRRGRRTACPRAEPPYAAAAFADCGAQDRTDRTPYRPPWPACVLDFAGLLAGLPLMPNSGCHETEYFCTALYIIYGAEDRQFIHAAVMGDAPTRRVGLCWQRGGRHAQIGQLCVCRSNADSRRRIGATVRRAYGGWCVRPTRGCGCLRAVRLCGGRARRRGVRAGRNHHQPGSGRDRSGEDESQTAQLSGPFGQPCPAARPCPSRLLIP